MSAIDAAPRPGGTVEVRDRVTVRESGRAVVDRARTVVACGALVAIAVSQEPGRVVPDTKLDLATDPVAFLGRALALWEPQAFAGTVQNQAYGYLFPMGPFFALARLLGVAPWLSQRLWIAALMCLAFVGVVTLTERLGIGSASSRLLAGFAYALSPRMITELGPLSVEVLPMALVPWAVVPLVRGQRTGTPRRAALRSALVIAATGGVNASATAVVLLAPLLFLGTRAAGPRRRALIAWWVAGVVLATAWWVGPLLLLGRYSPPFLDYIENATTTNTVTDVATTLRGTTQWVAYLSGPAGPLWPAGWSLAHGVVPLVTTAVLAATGLAALARRDLPERPWLVSCLVLGLVLVCGAHAGSVAGLFAEPARAALDGALAPLRNTHKFEPLVRLAVVVGLAHLLGRATARAFSPTSSARGLGVLALVLLCLVVTTSPAWSGRLSPPGSFVGLPSWWPDTARFLAGAQPSGRALVVPGSSFGTYVWGSPRDEPLQPLARSPWDVRDAIPLSPPGHIRMLDVVEARLARGAGGPGLTEVLARAGYSHVVVRNDLDGAQGVTTAVAVRQALTESPGLVRQATFGPVLVPGALPGVVVEDGVGIARPAVEVWSVAAPRPAVRVVPWSATARVTGGADGVSPLADRGLLRDRVALPPMPSAGDPPSAAFLQTDALVPRERAFGRLDDATSAPLSEDDPRRTTSPAADYGVPDAARETSSVRISGGTVGASSSGSDATSAGGARPWEQPFAAVDGDATTAWRPARSFVPAPSWWRMTWPDPLRGPEVRIALTVAPPGTGPVEVVVESDTDRRTVSLVPDGVPRPVALPVGSRSLTLRFPGSPGTPPGIAEVDVPDVRLDRTVVLPLPSGPVGVYAFDVTGAAQPGCFVGAPGATSCSAALVRGPEEARGLDRTFTVLRPDRFALTATVRPRPGPALDAVLADPAGGLRATASSVAVPDPRAGPGAVLDADPGTAWRASPDDPDPRLELSWTGARIVSALRLDLAPDLGAVPLSVDIDTPSGRRTATIGALGVVRFPPVRTDALTLRFPVREPTVSFDPRTRRASPLGVAVRDIALPGLAARPYDTVEIPCGAGPALTVGEAVVPTRVTASRADLLAGRPVPLRACGRGGEDGAGDGDTEVTRSAPEVALGVGEHRLVAPSTPLWWADSATLTAAGRAPDAPAVPATPLTWGPEFREVAIGPRAAESLLVVSENTNPGWEAELDGTALTPVVVDGWQQAWRLPPGPPTTVELRFVPGAIYRLLLVLGAVAVVVVAIQALRPARGVGPPGSGPRPVGRWTHLALVTGIGAATGPAGLGMLAVLRAAGLGDRGPRRRRVAVAPVAVGLLAASSGALAAAGAPAWAAVLTAVVAVVVIVVRVLPPVPGPAGDASRRAPGDGDVR